MMYTIIDTCNNDEEVTKVTLQGAREWLLDFWREDEDMTEEEFATFTTKVNDCLYPEDLNEYLDRIGYLIVADDMQAEADRLGWHILAHAPKQDHLYVVLVERPHAPFRERKWSTHLWNDSQKGFALGHYDMTAQEARESFLSRLS